MSKENNNPNSGNRSQSNGGSNGNQRNREVSNIVISEATISLRMELAMLQMQISYPIRGSLNLYARQPTAEEC